MVRLKVTVDWDTCISDGVCYALCPQVFEAGPDGKSQIVKEYRGSQPWEGVIPSELKDCVEQAKVACPVSAIKVEEVE
ncbi:MAG: ferredoxin [Desulfurococcales archaeon]|nr:ferredoxin [Desulfurococcales archaeon]